MRDHETRDTRQSSQQLLLLWKGKGGKHTWAKEAKRWKITTPEATTTTSNSSGRKGRRKGPDCCSVSHLEIRAYRQEARGRQAGRQAVISGVFLFDKKQKKSLQSGFDILVRDISRPTVTKKRNVHPCIRA
jgi:hypothetical protein